MKEQVRISRS